MIDFDASDVYAIKNRGVVFAGLTDRAFDSLSALEDFYLRKTVRIRLYHSVILIKCIGVERFPLAGPRPAGQKIGLLAGDSETEQQ